MDEPPPTYSEATSRNPLPLIAPYLLPTDIYPCTTVSHSWNQVFSRFLWSIPHKFWDPAGTHDISILEYFLSAVAAIPPHRHEHTTAHVQSLDLSRIHSGGVAGSLPPSWLTAVLTLLPNLATLNLSGFEFLSHDAVRSYLTPYTTAPLPKPHQRALRTLVMRNVQTLYASLLASFLRTGWACLKTIDLRGTPAARNAAVISALVDEHVLPSLRRVGLRDTGLGGDDFRALVRGMGTRLAWLDIRGTAVTGSALEMLLDWCFLPPGYEGQNVGDGDGAGMIGLFLPDGVGGKMVERLIQTTRLRELDCGAVGDEEVSGIRRAGKKYAGGMRKLRVDYRVFLGKGGEWGSLSSLRYLDTLVLSGLPPVLPTTLPLKESLRQLITDFEARPLVNTKANLLTLILETTDTTSNQMSRSLSSSSEEYHNNSDSDDDDEDDGEDEFSFFADERSDDWLTSGLAGGRELTGSKFNKSALQLGSSKPTTTGTAPLLVDTVRELVGDRRGGRVRVRVVGKGQIGSWRLGDFEGEVDL